MTERKIGSVPAETTRADKVDRLARDMLTTFDRIIHQLMTAVALERGDEEIPLTFQEVRAFKTVSVREPITMNALASAIRISLPATTHLVDSLVAKGALVRTRTKEDRRLVLVSMSKKAKACVQKVFDDRVAMILRILKRLAPAERKRVAEAMDEIARVLQAGPGVFGEHADANAVARTPRKRKPNLLSQ
jgi:DNA-binding MarR family transcriptional regulator